MNISVKVGKIGMILKNWFFSFCLQHPLSRWILLIYVDNIIEGSRSSIDSSGYAQVLNLYKRNSLGMQLFALFKQTRTPSKLLIYQNESYVQIAPLWLVKRLKNVDITINRNWNAKYHGRFYASLMLEEPYIILWDDDISPGRKWNDLCVMASSSSNGAVVTGNGRLIEVVNSEELSIKQHGIELSQGVRTIPETIVDYGGHSWCFPSMAIPEMAGIRPPTHANSEDFHISAATYISSQRVTLVPAHSASNIDCVPDTSIFRPGSRKYAVDAHASHRLISEFANTRNKIIAKWISDYGYVPVTSRS